MPRAAREPVHESFRIPRVPVNKPEAGEYAQGSRGRGVGAGVVPRTDVPAPRVTRMLPGPVFHVELLTTARRFRSYAIRFGYGLFLLFFIWMNDPDLFDSRYGYGNHGSQAGLTIQEMAEIGRAIFRSFVIVQGVAILLLTPAFVAGAVAQEKQRKTLHYLLASQLTSGEIILGKLSSRLLHVAIFLAIGLPIISLLSIFGGVDPQDLVLASAASMTTAFFLAALAILVSTLSRRPREAITVVYLLELAWLFVPPWLRFALPMASPFWRQVHQLINPINEWIALSSPFSLSFLSGQIGPFGPSAMNEALAWMMGLHIAFGAIFVTLAVAWLRPGFRDDEGSPRLLGGLGRAMRGRRFLHRPSCGDDAMLWKERYVSRTTAITKASSALIMLVVGALLSYHTLDFALPAFREVLESGYGAISGYNSACQQFHGFLRGVCCLIYVAWTLAVAGAAAHGLAHEREEETWTSLIATPLSSLEIIRAKMFGAFWGMRWMGLLLLALCLLGVAAGAVHPFGFAAVTIESAAFVWFADALGTYYSLKTRSSSRALVASIATLVLLNGGYLMCCVPLRADTPWIVIGVTPFIEAASLLSYDEFSSLFATGPYAVRYRHYGETAFICFAGCAMYLAAAAILTSLAINQFDEEIDRPRRAGQLPPFPVLEEKPEPAEKVE